MPRNVAQWTGIVVTIIVVLGRDRDVFTALPLGISSGLLASLFAVAFRPPVLAHIGRTTIRVIANLPWPKLLNAALVLPRSPH
jgi:hypothetical protein